MDFCTLCKGASIYDGTRGVEEGHGKADQVRKGVSMDFIVNADRGEE